MNISLYTHETRLALHTTDKHIRLLLVIISLTLPFSSYSKVTTSIATHLGQRALLDNKDRAGVKVNSRQCLIPPRVVFGKYRK